MREHDAHRSPRLPTLDLNALDEVLGGTGNGRTCLRGAAAGAAVIGPSYGALATGIGWLVGSLTKHMGGRRGAVQMGLTGLLSGTGLGAAVGCLSR